MLKKIFIKFLRKDIDTKRINNFNRVIKAIKEFILLKEFDKAIFGIDEIIEKENKSFSKFIITIENEKEKKNYIKNLNKRLRVLELLKLEARKQKEKYLENIKEQRLKVDKKNLEKNLKIHISKNEYDISTKILNDFFEKYKDDIKTIDYVNSRKKEIFSKMNKYKENQDKLIKNDTISEIKNLVWDIVNEKDVENNNSEKYNFLSKTKKIFKKHFSLRKKIIDKKLLDEIDLLINSSDENKKNQVKLKLSNIHTWISKDISNKNINWYELYWKILWADKISWDAIWFSETKKDYTFFLWDATWHWLRAWLIITKLTKKFDEIAEKFSFSKICFDINNSLKQDLKSGNFITWVFFSIDKLKNDILNFVWMWHEPMFVYRKDINTIEKVIPWWLAAWIRLIKNKEDIKIKNIKLNDWDILICYTDWITESKNISWEMYSIERLWETFKKISNNNSNLKDIYEKIINDLKDFKWWSTNFYDDVSILLIKRDTKKDFIFEDTKIKDLLKQEWLETNISKKIKWKNISEIKKDIQKYRKEKELKNILKILDSLYKTAEYPKLKQECIRYIKDWFIDKKINFYLKKAINNEENFKNRQKNKKLQDKYNVLKELYNKWEYNTVMRETIDVISKEWNI